LAFAKSPSHRQNRFYLTTIFATQPESSGWQSRNECT
jgi:hypothetical protein